MGYEFPTASARGYTLGLSGEGRVAGEGARATFPKGDGGNAGASRALRIGKETNSRGIPACAISFPNVSLVDGRLRQLWLADRTIANDS